jgi:hypothetical protein
MRTWMLLSGFTALSMAQPPQPPLPAFPDALRQYLQLTPSQADTLVRLNDRFRQSSYPGQQRIVQLQEEIDRETAKETLDPQTLGVRYVEIEMIRREFKDSLDKLRRQARLSLTDAQRAKLDAIDEAVRLQPVIAQANCFNLLSAPLPETQAAAACAEFRREP